ncbi:MAG TPA: FtsH protease activity modulator HflK [Myxococcaceae bacterium]|nr:FtsH protease activity modulator HflK [Myxococcaceae bacterium]
MRERFGRHAGRKLLLGLGALLLVTAALTSYAQVEPDEVGVVLRLGRYAETVGPGPHFRLPFGIDRLIKVPVQRQLKMEFGFRTASSGTRAVYAEGDREARRESMMLTGDLNVAVVEWIVQYKVKDPVQYLFRVKSVDDTLHDIAEASMRIVVGDHSVNEVLTTGRTAIAARSKELLQELADRYQTGVDIQQVVLQDVNPPDPVKPSFNEVNQAVQEKERMINEAFAELNRAIPRARGEAEQAIRGAEGYAIERVNRARGEGDRFIAIHDEYRRAPDVMRRRMYLETVSKALQRAGQKLILDENVKNITPLLRMDGEADLLPAVGAAAPAVEAPTSPSRGGKR